MPPPRLFPEVSLAVHTNVGETLQLNQGVGDVFVEPGLRKYQQALLIVFNTYPPVGVELLHFASERANVAHDHTRQRRPASLPVETLLGPRVSSSIL